MVKGQSKRKYTAEFRQGAVALVLKEKRSVKQAAADLGMPEHTLNAWVGQARQGKGVFQPEEQKDLTARVRELEAENRRLRIERDILKKATAFFAKEEGSRP
jgi:transposase-like protein